MPPPKPFLMTAKDAATIMRRKIEGGARRLVLPWRFALILALSRWVPRALIRRSCEGRCLERHVRPTGTHESRMGRASS